ncbi:MAG: isoprenylcysteine carboxylmethyltransferase family protein [Terrimesophilobacter sp.]
MKRAFVLVTAQLLLLAALVLIPHDSLWPVGPLALVIVIVLVLAGAALAILGVVGLGSALTASPIPRENAGLVTDGIYGLVRNPIYSGLLVGGLGLVVFGASLWHILVWVALALLLAGKARWEERMLVAKHPEFDHYAARVGRFLPWTGRLRPRR